MSILLYGCTTWTLTKRIEKKLDGNCTRILRAILKKFWKQHPAIQQLYGSVLGVTVIVVRNGCDDLSSNSERGCISQNVNKFGKGMNLTILPPAGDK